MSTTASERHSMAASLGDPFAPGLLGRLPRPPRKVAVLRPSRVGDFVCAGPALRALRHALPEAEIVIITLPLLRDLALRSPHCDRFEAFPGFPGLAEQLFEARAVLQFLSRMQRERFDLAIQMQGSGVYSNTFTLMLGAAATAGFVRDGDTAGRLDAALPLPRVGHEIQRVLALPQFLGAAPQGTESEFPLSARDHAVAKSLLRGAVPPLIGLHVGARHSTRRWPLERFAAAGAQLRRRWGGTVVVVGGPELRPEGELLCEQMGPGCLNLIGRTALPVLGAVIARLALLLTNDSGPAHIAYALATPTVTVFGGADPLRYGPPASGPFRALVHEVGCRPCHDGPCANAYQCLDGIAVGEAIAAAEQVVSQQGTGRACPNHGERIGAGHVEGTGSRAEL